MIYTIKNTKIRVEIFRPNMPLETWYSKQTIKPDILLNASLYKSDRTPIGTIIENGALVRNSGTGFGFGVMPDDTCGFGLPWSGWKEYLTGYYGIVQYGNVISPPFNDSYVFDQKHNRIAIGERRGEICIATFDNCDIMAFARYCYDQGLTSAVNLDGGGSRYLRADGRLIHNSTRTPYNAIAIYYEGSPTPDKGAQPMNVLCKKKSGTLDASGKAEIGRYIDKGDRCVINPVITDNLLVEIEYPVSKGTRRAYVNSLANFTRA